LLLPNTDLTLTFFGKPVYDIVQKAKRDARDPIAVRDPVWTYKAPQKCGGGSIVIRIYSNSAYWSRDILNPAALPDALIGSNAGITSYHEWGDPMAFSTMSESFSSFYQPCVRFSLFFYSGGQVGNPFRNHRLRRAVFETLWS
jgi:hypothetical protein